MGEPRHRLVELQERVGLIVDGDVRVVERDAASIATALLRAAGLRAVDEHMAHGERRHGEEVRAIAPVGV
jgi:hypothetical protein